MTTKTMNRPPAVEPIQLERLFTIEEVAASLGMSRRTANRKRAKGEFPKADIGGARPKWRKKTVDAWIESQVRGN